MSECVSLKPHVAVGGAWPKMTASAVAAIRLIGPVFIEK